MRRQVRRLLLTASLAACIAPRLPAQKNLTWEQAKRELVASNPNLRASQIGIQEARADEITAYLRPNPDLTVSIDQISPLTTPDYPYRPFSDSVPLVSTSYLIERRHKRSLRRESAQESTAIAISELDDQRRNLLFDLRTVFPHEEDKLAAAISSLSRTDLLAGPIDTL